MGKVKSEGHIVGPVSNQCTSFLFYVNRTYHEYDKANNLFDL